jgi:hypothetical protein
MGEWLQVPLGDPSCRRRALVGQEMVLLASLSDLAPTLRTLVVSAPIVTWLDRLSTQPVAQFAELSDAIRGMVSIRGWWLRAGLPDQLAGPLLNNIDPTDLADTVVEYVWDAERICSWRAGDRLVLALQRFIPADASARVLVDPAARRVRVRVCWGLAEVLAEPLHFDRFVFSGDELEIGEHLVVHKPTATVGADAGAGTCTVPVPAERHRESVLTMATARRLAVTGLAAADRLGLIELEFALFDGQPFLVGCAPVGPMARLG